MRKVFGIGATLTFLVIITFVCLVFLKRPRHYEILYAAFLPGGSEAIVRKPYAICYSNAQLQQVVSSADVIDRASMRPFDLDKPDVFACVITDYKVEEVTGRGQIGSIVVNRSPTSGVSFTVLRGKKRLFQFRHMGRILVLPAETTK